MLGVCCDFGCCFLVGDCVALLPALLEVLDPDLLKNDVPSKPINSPASFITLPKGAAKSSYKPRPIAETLSPIAFKPGNKFLFPAKSPTAPAAFPAIEPAAEAPLEIAPVNRVPPGNILIALPANLTPAPSTLAKAAAA